MPSSHLVSRHKIAAHPAPNLIPWPKNLQAHAADNPAEYNVPFFGDAMHPVRHRSGHGRTGPQLTPTYANVAGNGQLATIFGVGGSGERMPPKSLLGRNRPWAVVNGRPSLSSTTARKTAPNRPFFTSIRPRTGRYPRACLLRVLLVIFGGPAVDLPAPPAQSYVISQINPLIS